MIDDEKENCIKRPLLVVDTSILADSLHRRKGGWMVRNTRQWLYFFVALIIVVIVYRWLIARPAYEYATEVDDFDKERNKVSCLFCLHYVIPLNAYRRSALLAQLLYKRRCCALFDRICNVVDSTLTARESTRPTLYIIIDTNCCHIGEFVYLVNSDIYLKKRWLVITKKS